MKEAEKEGLTDELVEKWKRLWEAQREREDMFINMIDKEIDEYKKGKKNAEVKDSPLRGPRMFDG